MDDYITSGRHARCTASANPKSDSCWDLLQFNAQPQFQTKQGSHETNFHQGFMRRQQSSIGQDKQRLLYEAASQDRLERSTMRRREHLSSIDSLSYHGYNILTGVDVVPTMNKAPHQGRRHIAERSENEICTKGAGSSVGRLRDSTSRFYCTPDQLPHREVRAQHLRNDGLTVTSRTSTVIGVGPNRAQEIRSSGVREALNDSLYGLNRRGKIGMMS